MKKSTVKAALIDFYSVYKTNTQVTLEINTKGGIGYTAGIQVLKINSKNKILYEERFRGKIPEMEIGSSRSLENKMLQVICLLTNTTPESVKAGMELQLRNGVKDIQWNFEDEVEKGASKVFSALITFLHPSTKEKLLS